MIWLFAAFIFMPLAILLLFMNLAFGKKPIPFKNLHNKHILITGGSKGIGRALARECVKRGAHVTIIARNFDQLDATRDELTKFVIGSSQRIRTASIDLTSAYSEVKKSLDHCLGDEPIDMLINNAGGARDGSFDQLDAYIFEQQIKTNYVSAAHVTKACINRLKKAALTSECGTRIVFLSSQAGQVGLYGYTAYSASKFALRGFAESLQMELKPHNVWITIAHPPNTDTEGYANEVLHSPAATKLISDTSGLVEPDRLAHAILKDACSGRFCSSFGLDGWMLSVLCCGMSPETNLGLCLQQVFLSGLFRLISLFYLKRFDGIVRQCGKSETDKLS